MTLNLTAGVINAPGDWSDFSISGYTESSTMYDAIIRARQRNSAGQQVGQAKVTVLWTVYTPVNPLAGENGVIHFDNAARSDIINVVYVGGNGALGGPQRFNDRIGMATEFRAEVYPRNYDPASFNNSTVISARAWSRGMWTVNATGGNPIVIVPPGGPFPDRSPALARDDDPLQNGYIYDWDNPGPRVYAAPASFANVNVGHFVIQRANFRAWTVFHTVSGTEIRCSNDYYWTSSTTVVRTGQGTANDWRGAVAPNINRQNEAIGSYTQADATVPMNADGQ
jgi:hypothetical protein